MGLYLEKSGVEEKARNSGASEIVKDISPKPSTMVNVKRRVDHKRAKHKKQM